MVPNIFSGENIHYDCSFSHLPIFVLSQIVCILNFGTLILFLVTQLFIDFWIFLFCRLSQFWDFG